MVKQPAQGQVEIQPGENPIAELLCSLWRKRGIVLVALVVGALIGIAAASTSISRSPAPVTYYVALTGMEISLQDNSGANGRLQVTVSYPNGTAFLPRDLLDRQVLTRVREQLGLGNDVPLERGIGVSFDSPWSEGILRRYKDRLAARGIAQADIDALNRDLERDLLTANMGGLRIDVSPAALHVSNEVAIAIAKALPQAWRDIYTERYRTLLAAGVPNLAAGQAEGNVASASGTVAAQMKIVAMMRGLELIGTDNRLAGVINGSGQTASDLESELRQFRTVHFEPFAAAVFASNDPSVVAYRKDLEMRLETTKRDALVVDRTIQDMLNNPMGKANLPSLDSNVQMDGTMLAQVLGLAQRASLTPLMPNMFERREKVGAEIARLENELVMASAQGTAPSVARESADAISTELKRLTESYKDLYSAAVERLRTTSSEFYADLSAPVVASQGLGTRTLALFITPIALALVVAIGYLLLAGLMTRALSRR